MRLADKIEFYLGTTLLAVVDSAMVPPVKAKISIRKKVYTVLSVTYALDHADEPVLQRMRANVDLRLG